MFIQIAPLIICSSNARHNTAQMDLKLTLADLVWIVLLSPVVTAASLRMDSDSHVELSMIVLLTTVVAPLTDTNCLALVGRL